MWSSTKFKNVLFEITFPRLQPPRHEPRTVEIGGVVQLEDLHAKKFPTMTEALYSYRLHRGRGNQEFFPDGPHSPGTAVQEVCDLV